MTLADSCFDFCHTDVPFEHAAKSLLDSVEWYAPAKYPPEHINALRSAVKRALATPDDIRLRRRLYLLAELVRATEDAQSVTKCSSGISTS